MRWKFDHVFFEKKKRRKTLLEKLYNKIADATNETFTKIYYFVKISQSKKGHIYLIVRKKRGRLIVEKALHRKIFDVSRSVFNWFCKNELKLSFLLVFNFQ